MPLTARPWHSRYALFTGALALAGCMTVGSRTTTSLRHPDDGSPLAAGGPMIEGTVGPNHSRTLDRQPAFVPAEPQRNGESDRNRRPSPAQENGPGSSLSPGSTDERPSLSIIPKVELGEVTVAPAKLELLVNVPKRKQVGSPVAYRLLIRNTGAQPAEDVDVHCQFDPKLIFDDSSRREVRGRLGRLLPGESKELTLNLVARDTGSHCCRFSVRARQSGSAAGLKGTEHATLEAVWKSVCVEFVTQQVQIDMLGPTLRTVGSRAEFNFKVTNRSKKQLPKVRVALSHDAALAPVVATQGATRGRLALTWDLADLQPDESAQFQVDFDCRNAAHRACVQLETSGEGIPDDQTESCLQIVPIQGTLDLRISDVDDPILIGKRGKYEITVQNTGLQPAPQVRLDVHLPPPLKGVSAQVTQAGKLLPLKYALENGKLLFDPVPQLAPDEKLIFIVEVEGTSEGIADVRATVHSGLSHTAVSASEPTWVSGE